MTTGAKSFPTLMVALALFGLAGSVMAVMAPSLFVAHPRPDFTLFLITGVAIIFLTAALFALIARLGVGFGRTALVLAAGYNALIGAVKLGLAPAALYGANSEQAFDTSAGDPNSLWFYLGVGSGVFLLYLLVFWVMYGIFRRRLGPTEGARDTQTGRRIRQSGRRRVILVLVAAAFVVSFLWALPSSSSGCRPSPT